MPVAERAAVAGQLFGEEGSIAMARIDTATLRTGGNIIWATDFREESETTRHGGGGKGGGGGGGTKVT